MPYIPFLSQPIESEAELKVALGVPSGSWLGRAAWRCST